VIFHLKFSVLQVTISALEDSKLLTWNPKAYHQYLQTNPFVDSLLTNLMGKDITVKLYQLQEMLRHPQQQDSRCSSVADLHYDIIGNNNHDNAPVPTFNETIEKLHRYSVSASRKSGKKIYSRCFQMHEGISAFAPSPCSIAISS
jgi:hypothetical protein